MAKTVLNFVLIMLVGAGAYLGAFIIVRLLRDGSDVDVAALASENAIMALTVGVIIAVVSALTGKRKTGE